MSAAEWEPTTCAWLAGFIDGEGSISVIRERDRRRGTTGLRPALQIVNTSEEVIALIHALIPASSSLKVTRVTRPHHKPVFRLVVRNSRAILAVLEAIIPYLIVKRQVAQLMVIYLRGRINTARGRYNLYEPRDFALYEEIRVLNRRGVAV